VNAIVVAPLSEFHIKVAQKRPFVFPQGELIDSLLHCIRSDSIHGRFHHNQPIKEAGKGERKSAFQFQYLFKEIHYLAAPVELEVSAWDMTCNYSNGHQGFFPPVSGFKWSNQVFQELCDYFLRILKRYEAIFIRFF